MKKLNVYEINDGIDGVIIAKNLKQAMKKLSAYCGEPVSELLKSIKEYEEEENINSCWVLTGEYKELKRGLNKKAKIKGWCQ